jgi:AraC-like DNA-binding protein
LRQEPVLDLQNLRTDSRGITRNHQLTSHLNRLSVDILDHGYFIGNQHWNQYNVVSPFSRIYYMIADSGWLETADGKIDLLPGYMYLIPSNTRVNLRTAERIEKFYFHVSLHYDDMDILDGIKHCYTLPLTDSLLQDLLAAFHSGGLGGLLALKSVAYRTLDAFWRESLPDLSDKLELASRYQDVYAYVNDNLSAILTAPAICAALGRSYESFRRQFRADNGVTLHQFIHGRLIQQAAILLLMTDLTIQQIASRLGFQDEFYFSRLFKQKMEYSPREYRRINALLRRKDN